MKVKHVLEELQKLNPEFECIAKAPDGGYNSVIEIKPVSVIPFHVSGTTYFNCDYVHDMMGYVALEIVSRCSRK